MRFTASTLDDLCRKLFPKLLKGGYLITPSRGRALERCGVLLELTQPRARLSRTETRGKPFSCLGELLWYLSGDNRLDFIRYYIDSYKKETEDGETVYGGYGPRLFRQRGNNQIQNVIRLLRTGFETRRAVIQLFNAEDIARRHKEIPCTCILQFMVRRRRLHALVTMRSNDAYLGLPPDVFCFTMLQELLARSLGLEPGPYKHFVGSLHLYEEDSELVSQYLDEGVQSSIAMPAMPPGDPWPAMAKLQQAEEQIRNGLEPDAACFNTDPYWCDLIRLLQALAATGDVKKIEAINSSIYFKGYTPYIDSRKVMKPRVVQPPRQLVLPFGLR
jgi:thymidylate synthase